MGHTLSRSRLHLQGDFRRFLENFLGQFLDGSRHGGAEKENLLRLGHVPEHSPDVGKEAHVQHSVGLVQYQILQPGQGRVVVLEVIEKPPRGGDDDVRPSSERGLLLTHAHATVHHSRLEPGELGQGIEVVPDLAGELSSRGHDQSAGRAAWLVHQLVKDGQKEGCGFAAARGGTSEQVPAFEGRGDRFRLNRGRALKAQFVDASKEGRVQLECRKIQGSSDMKALSRRAGLSRSISWRRFRSEEWRPEPKVRYADSRWRKVVEERVGRQHLRRPASRYSEFPSRRRSRTPGPNSAWIGAPGVGARDRAPCRWRKAHPPRNHWFHRARWTKHRWETGVWPPTIHEQPAAGLQGSVRLNNETGEFGHGPLTGYFPGPSAVSITNAASAAQRMGDGSNSSRTASAVVRPNIPLYPFFASW